MSHFNRHKSNKLALSRIRSEVQHLLVHAVTYGRKIVRKDGEHLQLIVFTVVFWGTIYTYILRHSSCGLRAERV